MVFLTDTGCSNTVSGYKKYFVDDSLLKLKTCAEIKGIAGSCKATNKGVLEMERVDKNG